MSNSINPRIVLPSPKSTVQVHKTETTYTQAKKPKKRQKSFWLVPTGVLSSIHLRCYASCEGITIPCEACLEYECSKTRSTFPGLIEVPICP